MNVIPLISQGVSILSIVMVIIIALSGIYTLLKRLEYSLSINEEFCFPCRVFNNKGYHQKALTSRTEQQYYYCHHDLS